MLVAVFRPCEMYDVEVTSGDDSSDINIHRQ